MFQIKVIWFRETYDAWFNFEKLFESHVKIIINFLNEISYISLHILIAYLESFLKHYNQVLFIIFIKLFLLSIFRIIRLASIAGKLSII